MEKVCQDWSGEAFDSKLVNASYWDEFARNAESASAEIIRIANMEEAERELRRIADELDVHKVIAVGGEENPALQRAYDKLTRNGILVYTDKFDIAEQAPTADLGISTGVWCRGDGQRLRGYVLVRIQSYGDAATGAYRVHEGLAYRQECPHGIQGDQPCVPEGLHGLHYRTKPHGRYRACAQSGRAWT